VKTIEKLNSQTQKPLIVL